LHWAFAILIGVAVALTLGGGTLVNLPHEYTAARICYAIAFMILLILAGHWFGFGRPEKESWIASLIGVFLIFGSIGSLWVISTIWVAQRQHARLIVNNTGAPPESKREAATKTEQPTQPTKPSTTQEQRFSVSLVNAFLGWPFAFAYNPGNDTLYYIEYLICIELVNKSVGFSKINSYYAQLSCGDEWVNLQHIPFNDNGQFYLLGKENMSIEFLLKTIDEQIKGVNIEPGKTIPGILMFYLKEGDRKKCDPQKVETMKLVIF